MVDTTIEQNKTAEGLENLSKGDREETQEILNEIDKENASKPEVEPTVDKKPEETEKKPEEVKPTEEKKPEDIKPEPRRETKFVPAWMLEMEKDRAAKREEQLKKDQEKENKAPLENKPEDTTAPEFDKAVKDLVEEEGISESLAKRIITAERKGVVPPEVAAEIATIKQQREETAIQLETTAFNSDFDKFILPLIKAEYGHDIPTEAVERMRDELKAKAYTPEYAKVPYTTIYKGEDAFRGVVAERKKGAEQGRGGSVFAAENAGEGQLDLTKPLSDEAVDKLSPDDFEKYCKNMEAYEKSQKSQG